MKTIHYIKLLDNNIRQCLKQAD